MPSNVVVPVDPSLIDALNEATTGSPEDVLSEADDLAECEGIDRNTAFDHLTGRFATIN